MLRKICALLVLCLIVHRGAASTTLEFSYADPVYIDVVHTAVKEAAVMGTNTKSETKVHFLFKVDAGEVAKDKTTCTVTILECSDTTTTNGKVEDEDSLKAFKNQKFEIVISDNNHKIELRKTDAVLKSAKADMAEDLADASAEEKKMIDELLKAVLKIHLVDALIPLPAKPVEKGDKWRHKSSTGIPGVAEITADREFVFQGEKKEKEKSLGLIEWSSKVDFKMKKDPDNPVTVAEKPGVTQKNTGSASWDIEADRPSRVENNQTYQLEMTLEMQGKKNKFTIKTIDDFVFTYYDTKPGK